MHAEIQSDGNGNATAGAKEKKQNLTVHNFTFLIEHQIICKKDALN